MAINFWISGPRSTGFGLFGFRDSVGLSQLQFVLNKYVNSFNYKPEQPASLIALSLGVTPKASNRSDGIRATWQDITFSHFTQQLMIIPAFAKLDEIAHQAL